MKAYLVVPKGWPLRDGGIGVAETAGKARYRSYLSASDMGSSLRVCDFRALRLPELDSWATSLTDQERRESGGFVPEYVPGGRDAAAARAAREAAS